MAPSSTRQLASPRRSKFSSPFPPSISVVQPIQPSTVAQPATSTAAAMTIRRFIALSSGLFHLDVGGLDDRRPFLDLGLVESRKPFRRLLLARGDVEPEVREARAHERIGERLHQRGVEPGDDFLRQPPRAEQAEPSRSVETGDAAFF